MLMAGRVQYSLVGTLNAGYIFKAHAQSFPTKPFLIATNETQGLYVSFSLKHPQSKVAAELLDEGLKKIRDSGVYAEILQKWLRLYPYENPKQPRG
jgi:polar amino acid transport system substrate-binding protein